MKIFLLVLIAGVALTEGLAVPKFGQSDRTRQYLRQKTNTRSRILGGDVADIAQFPHMLVLLDLTFGGFICGAGAISDRWAVTAAHCLEFNTPPSEINLRGGSSNRLTGGHIFFAESYSLHPQYDPNWLDFDIALIRVQENTPIQGTNVQPIRISPPCPTLCCQACEPEDVTITGWG
jgi:secreted trypsin-like serine protease